MVPLKVGSAVAFGVFMLAADPTAKGVSRQCLGRLSLRFDCSNILHVAHRFRGSNHCGGHLTQSRADDFRPVVFPKYTRRCTSIRCKGQDSAKRIAFMPLSTFFLVLLVGHKCLTDGLSRFTRMSGVPYSGTTAAFLGEVVKVPVLLVAILTFEGWSSLRPILKASVTSSPFSLAFLGLAYAAQNILYFEALSHLSVAGYQLISQSKLLFTGLFMSVMLKKRLSGRQYAALVLLMCGTVFTQLSEMSRSASAGGNALYGGILTLLGALLAALPNVYYEKVLKTEGVNQWVKNIQITFWIWFWIVVISIPSLFGSGGIQQMTTSNMFAGISAWVWVVIVLQSLKCLLIPATLKYADNIMYAFAKPSSILVTAFCSAAISKILPNAQFILGTALVFASMWLYGS